MIALEAAQRLLTLGIAPLPLPFQSKKPTLRDWPALRLTAETLPQYFNGTPCNIGGLLGAPSQGVVSIDCDWPEAGKLARHLLPPSWVFGRSGRVRHWLVRAPDANNTAFDAPATLAQGEKRRVVELLGTGKQAMLPGSVHPSGERIEWIVSPDVQALADVEAEQLLSRVSALAGAALLVRLWPELEGSRHDVALALAGSLHHGGWPIQRIEKLLVAILATADDPERLDRGRAAADTLRAAQDGKPITGLPRLAERLPDDVLQQLVKWWQLGSTGPVLTFGGSPAPVQPCRPQPPVAQDWPELLPFESRPCTASEHPYPVDRLGSLLGGAVEAIVYRQQVPAALAAQSILAAAATTVHAYQDIECDGRRLPLALWLALVAGPGERKTSSDDIAFARLRLRMHEAQQRYRIALEGWKADRADKDAGDPGPRPRNPVWMLTDATTEGLKKTLDRHWPALTLTNSDAASWVSGYSMRDGRDSATAATLSALWSGSWDASARASQEEPAVLFGRRLSLSLMLQPALAAELFESSTLAGQGFLSRCLPAFPPSTMGRRPYRRAVADERLERFYAAQDALLLQPPDMTLETGELHPKGLTVTEAGIEAWIAHHDRLEAALIGEYADIAEVANKFADQMLRLAGVRAALEGRDRVGPELIEDAAGLVQWYAEQWQTLAGKLVAHRREVALPGQLLEWLRQKRRETGQDVFNLRDVYRSGPRIVRNRADHARELMMELLRRGYVRVQGKDYELRPEADL